jgi:hypothetical protein
MNVKHAVGTEYWHGIIVQLGLLFLLLVPLLGRLVDIEHTIFILKNRSLLL